MLMKVMGSPAAAAAAVTEAGNNLDIGMAVPSVAQWFVSISGKAVNASTTSDTTIQPSEGVEGESYDGFHSKVWDPSSSMALGEVMEGTSFESAWEEEVRKT